MLTHFFAVIASILNIHSFSFLNLSHVSDVSSDNQPREARFTVQCSEPAWVGTPGLRGGIFEGTLNANCDVALKAVGNFTHLQNQLGSRMANENVKVNAGPIPETYKEMPSQYFDVTMSGDGQGEHVTIDQDIHIATNSKDLLFFDTVSRKIVGSGMSQYLLSMNAFAKVTTAATADPVDFKIEFTNSVRIKKPALVPGGMFVSKVKAQLMQVAKEQLPKLVPPLAEGLME